ncbi:YadA C-terminal domain-containing protein [Haemophilus haemolyticus]|uniref:YadA C-terminal domain-containing protein n=1 Tax=Haemophilus haemolyticus TaxID=726 RepID=UPI001EFE84D4|nr:YadA C-terminal domain-containing protein [Haemophilus haemolyticus]
MKKNSLKQSVIAVLVGGALSASAFAQEINTGDNSGAAFTKGVRNSLVAAIQGNSQILNGFKKDEKILAVNNSGNLEERNATEDDVNSDPLKGKGVVNSVLENQAGIKANADTLEFLGEITGSNINSLKNRVADNEVDIEDLKTNLTTLGESTNTAVSNLGEYIQNVDQDVADLNETVFGNDGLLNTVDSHTDAIADLQNRNDYRDLDKVRNLVTGAERGVAKNASRITDIRNKQLLQIERLRNHSDRIGVNEGAIATHTAAIATHTAAIATHTAAIATHTAAIATHTQRLDNLDNRVNNLNKDLKRGLAAQAALNGLFQPYNVGKLNLTAAVGGYKSQTAVAVGTGYRYNENIATKAGVAFTRGGSATYNVGVNFEW